MKLSHQSVTGIRLIIAAASAVAALSAAAPALASDVTGRDITVRFADLDVDTVDGATLLLRRIEGAASRVCSPLDHGDLASRSRREACEKKLTSAAVSRVNSAVLATVYQSAGRDAPSVIAQAK
ncbi:MAG TPA: UrcA family protein [Steroidobacteraceae bacterium]|nr:UrcA family protein [Steroidobacteraceae bacterium]